MTITTDGDEGSLLPPSQRDLRDLGDFVRTQSRNDRALGQGFAAGRLIQARAVGDTSEAEDPAPGDDGGNTADDTQYEWQWEDRYTVTALGTQTIRLTYIPVDESLVVRWHPDGGGGLPLTNEHFTVDGQTVTIPDPGFLALRDQFSFQYQLDPGMEDAIEPWTVDWGSSWSYLALPSTTSTTSPTGGKIGDLSDHSTDSTAGWPDDPAPLGSGGTAGGGGPIVTTVSTKLLWTRLTVPAANTMTIRVRVEDNIIAYVNGVEVGFIPNFGSGAPPETAFVVDPSVLHNDAPNEVAFRVCDEYPPLLTGIYFDARIEGA